MSAPTRANVPRRRVAAKDAPVGKSVKVFGFLCQHTDSERLSCACSEAWRHTGRAQFHVGTVRMVEHRAVEFLDTVVRFTDGRIVYARSYAVTVIL